MTLKNHLLPCWFQLKHYSKTEDKTRDDPDLGTSEGIDIATIMLVSS